MGLDYPHEISFFTTYRCNSKCLNCLIWRGEKVTSNKRELGVEEINRIFADPLFVQCTNIGLAGGEPTISSFFWKLLEILPDDRNVAITTNALSTRRLIDFLKRSQCRKKYMIQVPLDGIGEINDRVRGVNGAYIKTIFLLEKLKELDVDRLVSFTINRLNYHQLTACYELANHYGAHFNTRIAHCGGAYANQENRAIFELDQRELDALDHSLDMIISQELNKSSHSPAKLVFLKKITDYYRGTQKNLPCMALKSGMVIDLYGDVFPNCPAMMRAIGNLHKENLSDIWSGKKANAVRVKISKLRCGGCWNDCQVVTNIAMNQGFLDSEYSKLKIALLKGKRIPHLIDFNQGYSPLLLVGWYDLGGDSKFRFRWTEQEFAILVPAGTASLEIFATPPPDSNTDKPYTMDVIIGQDKADRILLGESRWGKYSITLARPTCDLAACTFKLNRYYCPKEEGQSADWRKLGLAIHKISFFDK